MTAAASQRSPDQGRFSATQAMPGTISASATVSQPFSSARLSASASEAIEPVAKMALAASLPGRSPRLPIASVASAKAPASTHRGAGEGDRAVEAGDAVVERDEDGDGGEHRRRAPQNADQRAGCARPCARNPDTPNSRAKTPPSMSGAPNR